jgi:hypothetical protein
MSAGTISLRLFHAVVAIAAIAWLTSVLVERRGELGKVRELADKERADRQHADAELSRGQALRDGLKRDDPYVVEYLARDRLQFTGAGELAPPPVK